MKPKTMIYFMNDQDKKEITYKLKMLMRSSIVTSLAYEGFNNDCQVSLTFTDNEGIRRLNSEYRGIDAPTDVLSFPLIDFEGGDEPPAEESEIMLGDIVISLERAEEQAREFGHSVERETAFLCVHSMLHLLGYDHETSEEDDRDMRTRQRVIMELMGLAVASSAEDGE